MIKRITITRLSRIATSKAGGRNFGSQIVPAVGHSLKAQIALMRRRTPKLVGLERQIAKK